MKKLVMVVIVSVLIIILVGIGLFLFYNLPFIKEGSYDMSEFAACQKLQDNPAYNVYPQSICFSELANKNNSLSLCRNILNSDWKNYCFGVIKKRELFCSKIKDDELKSGCYYEISMGNKTWCEDIPLIKYFCSNGKSEKIKLCQKITGDNSGSGREECYLKVAIDFKDKSVCDNCDNSYYKDRCYGFYVLSVPSTDACENISTQYDKEVCYYNTAEKLKDKKICEKIIDSNNKDICYRRVAAAAENISLCQGIGNITLVEGCYFEVFEKTKNSSICNLITTQSIKDACNLEVVPNSNSPESNCDVINDTGFRDYCNRDIAKSKNDSTYCEKINEYDIRYECYADVGFSSKNITVCDKIGEDGESDSSDSWKEYCYEGAAADNIDLCYQLEYDKWKRQCILTIIVDKLKDPKLCSQIRVGQYIKDSTIIDDCYYELAMSLKNPELCNKINNSKSLQDCKTLAQ